MTVTRYDIAASNVTCNTDITIIIPFLSLPASIVAHLDLSENALWPTISLQRTLHIQLQDAHSLKRVSQIFRIPVVSCMRHILQSGKCKCRYVGKWSGSEKLIVFKYYKNMSIVLYYKMEIIEYLKGNIMIMINLITLISINSLRSEIMTEKLNTLWL